MYHCIVLENGKKLQAEAAAFVSFKSVLQITVVLNTLAFFLY